MGVDISDARSEYTSRRERWQATRQTHDRLFIQIGNWRLLLGITEAVLAYFVFGPHSLPFWTLFVPLLLFIALAIWHSRVLRRRTLAERALIYYDLNLARLDDRWSEKGVAGERFRDPQHVYSEDLDLFGKGSLFQLLSNARTGAGEELLAEWLLHPASPDAVVTRQAAVKELTGRLDLREDIGLLAEDARSTTGVAAFKGWGNAPLAVFSPTVRIAIAVFAAVGLVALVGFFAQQVPAWLFALVLGCDFLIMFLFRSRVNQILEAAEAPGHGLQIFAQMLARLEREQFESPYLQELRSSLSVKGSPASARIRALRRWTDCLDSSDHPLVRVIRPLVLWREQIAMGLEAWRRQSGKDVGNWLHAIAEFEALSSLASLAYERPSWSYPVLAGSDSVFESQGLLHPLLAPHKAMPNDVTLNSDLRLLIVSGSNMSGKSTLLRAIGLNCVLAWTGAPVAAKHLRLSQLRIGASIRVTDSLLDNRSRFFAEISRLRQVVDLTNQGHPVLFLFDELLSGTNSHDRRIGASAIVTKLVRDGAIGLVTTHDLALADIQKDLETLAKNVHFDDRIVEGQMLFDYTLREGMVTHSNALELMRAVGLEV